MGDFNTTARVIFFIFHRLMVLCVSNNIISYASFGNAS